MLWIFFDKKIKTKWNLAPFFWNSHSAECVPIAEARLRAGGMSDVAHVHRNLMAKNGTAEMARSAIKIIEVLKLGIL